MKKTTREMVSSMRTDWDIPERIKLLAYSIAYRFKAELWRKQTREQFLGMERRLQCLFQPTKSLAAADFGRIWKKDSHPAKNIGLGGFFFMLSLSSILMFPTSWAVFSNCACFCANGTILEFGYFVAYVKKIWQEHSRVVLFPDFNKFNVETGKRHK